MLIPLNADEKVRLQLKWLHQFQFAGYYAALEKGFYKEVGLDVEILERDIYKNNITQVLEGEAEYGIADSILLLYVVKNEPVVIIAPIFQHSPNVLLTLKSSGLSSPYDLDGKRLLFYRKDTDGFALLAMLKSLDIAPRIDRKKTESDHFSIVEGKADIFSAYITNEPYYFKQKGIDINIINPMNYGLDLYGDMLFTNQDEASKHPQRVEKFKQATIKGWEYALEHKEEIVELIHKKYATNKSKEHLMYEAKALEQLIQHKIIPIGSLDRGRLTYNFELYKKYGLIKSSVPIDNYIFEQRKISKTPKKKSDIFNAEEKQYLKDKKVIKLCVDPNWMPFEKIEDSKLSGMSADFFKLFQSSLSIPIELYPTQSWSESIQSVKSRKCDLVSLAIPTESREEYLDFTKAYLKVPLVISTRVEELFVNDLNDVLEKRIGIVKGYVFADILKKRYPGINIVEVQSIEEGLNMVAESKLYGFVDTLASIGYFIQREYIGTLKIAGKFGENLDLSIGTRNDEPLLKDIFEKLINDIPKDKQREILNSWISVIYETKTDYEEVLKWVLGLGFIFGIVISIFIVANARLKKEIARRLEIESKLQEKSITDELTLLYNRRYFNEIVKKMLNSSKREGKKIAFCILDIDFFKQYNDTYGHLAGDEVLKEISKVLKDSLKRGDDYAFRLGGEEFGILFKEQNTEDSLFFINSIKDKIENSMIEHKNSSVSKYVTASFGVVVKDANKIKNQDQLYKEADDLLYQAKHKGRNRVEINKE
ncbi:diguanylate cyclase [bacterium]|nr:diguanylate cyclase [bacterium]MBU1989121.1 diguanylate cyclase [bacterium]